MKNFVVMIIWYWRQIVSPSFCCDRLNISLSSHIFHEFSCIISNSNIKSLSKSFCAFFLRFVFISIYYFNQAFYLNIITLCSLFKTNPWFNACFKFLMCTTYSVLSCKLVTSFWTFSIFILTGKNGKSLWRLCTFSGYSTLTSRKYLYHFLQNNFL